MPKASIEIGERECRDFNVALKLEWLETNGLGGFASSTITGANTRRYHGLLTAATRPPVGRMVLLSKLEETLIVGGERFELSCNVYPGAIHPDGYRHLRTFRADPIPTFTYAIDGLELEKRVFMIHGTNATVIEYELRGAAGSNCSLEIRPLIAFRDYHCTTHANGALNGQFDVEHGVISLRPYDGAPTLYLANNAVDIDAEGAWYYNFEYDVERERGLDFMEDLFCPLVMRFDLAESRDAVVIASTESGYTVEDASRFRDAEIDRRTRARGNSLVDDPLVVALTAAADQFLVARQQGTTTIAGYHWFSDWGRDTMISLPGLTLVTGRTDAARDILLAFARYVDRGMLPNRFPDAGEAPEYNTVDAILWYFEAVRSYVEYTGDLDLVRERLYPVLKDILHCHLCGTRYGIHVDSDGLLSAGEPGVQLTWMDARVGDWVVTPRHGKPVEIQALWYNVLRTMQEFARALGDESTETLMRELAGHASENFNALFWNEAAGCFFDVVNAPVPDAAVRPNQVIAMSLRHTMVSAEHARQALAVIERELLTPYGLRTLAPSDPEYRGTYIGAPAERDAIYHQGTVWPWLLGPFISAYVKAHDSSAAARERTAGWLACIHDLLHTGCLGQLCEILDGDAPHHERGCAAQAWSVAEILRAAVEDVHGITPSKAMHLRRVEAVAA